MNTLKNLAWILGFLTAIFIGVGLVIPPEWEVTRDVTVQTDIYQVQHVVSRMETWRTWSPWGVMVDGGVQMQPGVIAEGNGATLTWKGAKVGSGSLTVTAEEKNKGLWFDARIGRYPLQGVFLYDEVGPGTTHVKLSLRGDAGYDVLGRYVGWYRSRNMGREIVESLTRLARRAEAGG
jgi:hypothetical protein